MGLNPGGKQMVSGPTAPQERIFAFSSQSVNPAVGALDRLLGRAKDPKFAGPEPGISWCSKSVLVRLALVDRLSIEIAGN
jgi:hypothetical protein